MDKTTKTLLTVVAGVTLSLGLVLTMYFTVGRPAAREIRRQFLLYEKPHLRDNPIQLKLELDAEWWW